ncbi:uncharacterized protein BT62DRAFT_1010202 [Guyanagaster necrorhizus]|uniref:Uncharacterized protein n=1 Tax=Guyanagaster necrorhizus TaxID=856835 RepID=A0A9P8ANR9_9AGAR|nr:uncharacterized protein BT62DRAFT_1010202 [Guyanagaster necrorhizus MCA 3950]KAG7442593.1 hypothetical protein BT62DRAFT_1010202 [Guyanagaster necrorhizus MCA 3950]
MALPDHGADTLWVDTGAAVFTYAHHIAVLYLNRRNQRTSKKFPVMSTLWCIITLFLIGALWLVALAFECISGPGYFLGPAVQALGYVVELLLTLIEAGIIIFLGSRCILERKHTKRAYGGTWDDLHPMNASE